MSLFGWFGTATVLFNLVIQYPSTHPILFNPRTPMRNRLVLTGLVAAITVSVVSALSISEANQNQQTPNSTANQSATEASDTAEEPENAVDKSESTELTEEMDAVKVGESQSSGLTNEKPAIAKIHSYQKEGRSVATLYVRNIPVATFLGPKDAKDSAAEETKVATVKPEEKQSAADPQDPVWRATRVAAILNQLDRDGIDADKIQVIWDKKRKSYVIKTDAAHVLEMSKLTILPKTTKDIGDDALKITNLLRRQIGEAKPLTTIPGRPKPPAPSIAAAPVRYQVSGEASWYGPGFNGNYTANGEIYNQYALTAAHKTLPFGTRVRVTNLYNGRSVVVRINDRGPFIAGRIIDLSQGAAQVIGVTSSGVAPVRMDILQ